MFTAIQPELNKIFDNLENDYALKSGHLSKFIPDFTECPVDTSLRPALLTLAAKIFHGFNEKCLVMAVVVQLIHLAQEIHNRIPDDCPKETPQFPVLVGDYLFSKFFKRLSDFHLLEWLAPLASTICKMNEGGIVRREVIESGRGREEDYLDVLHLEYGLLTGLSCKIGGVLAGCSEVQAGILEQFGLNLGMAWGTMKEQYPLAPGDFLNTARKYLLKIPGGEARQVMMSIIDEMEERAFRFSGQQGKVLYHAL